MSPRHRATLQLVFNDGDEAQRMLASIEPENDGFLQARVEGKFLLLEAQADSPLSLLRTLDDALACLGAAERAARVGGKKE